MSSFEGPEHDFDELTMPSEDLGSLGSEGMPDPTARQAVAVEEEAPPRKAAGATGGPGVMARIAQASPYTVMLAISLAAVLLAIFCLFRDYGAYRYDRPANAAKAVSAIAAPSPGPRDVRHA